MELRPAFDALFAIDDVMADVVEKATDPTLAAIKLAWWRDRLEALDEGQVPAEPRLQEAARVLLPKGLTGATLARLERGWAEALAAQADPSVLTERGALLFQMAARLLGWEEHTVVIATHGRLYAAMDLRRRGLVDDLPLGPGPATRVPRALRPVTALAALAARDASRRAQGMEHEATPGRALTLLKHRLSGRIG